MESINIFRILNVKREEDPHDRMLEWLCNPMMGHGMRDLAIAIVHHLWGTELPESIQRVKRPFNVGENSWPDLAVEFDTSLLLIENKVNSSALREGQLEKQHELGQTRQKTALFFHCLLCPDRMAATGISLESSAFRILTYSVLADLISTRADDLVPAARPIVDQYLEFIRSTLAVPVPSAIRLASATTIARRNQRRVVPWDLTEFLSEAERHGGAALVAAQQNLLDLFTAMEDVEPRFESRGDKDATYTLHLTKGDIGQLAWIHADGRLCPVWASFRVGAGDPAAEGRMRQIWAPYVKKPDNPEFFIHKRDTRCVTAGTRCRIISAERRHHTKPHFVPLLKRKSKANSEGLVRTICVRAMHHSPAR